MSVKPIKSFAEFRKAVNAERTSVVDFWAVWCEQCRAISPLVQQLAQEYSDKIDFYTVDVDALEEVAAEANVRSMPTFMVFRDGDKIGDLTGAYPDRLKALIQQHGGE